MSARYEVVARPGPGLAVLRRTDGDGSTETLWDRCKLRAANRCASSGRELRAGALVYRPVGNSFYRYERIDAAIIDAAESVA